MKIRYQLHRHCPTCGSDHVRRSRRQGLVERIIPPLLMLRPFRCRTCMRRYWGFWLARYVLEPGRAPAKLEHGWNADHTTAFQ